jgi:FKBP-type peptidyl-prolyl cis-trans isomerase FkpA
MKPAFLCFLMATAALSACKGNNDTPTAPSANVPYSQTDLSVGTGAEAMLGRNITAHYTGWLYDASAANNKGRQFTTTAGTPPQTFTLASGSLIGGWVQGIPGMRVGGIRRLVIPPNLAYGSAGRPPDIPGNATLIFEVELVAVQ